MKTPDKQALYARSLAMASALAAIAIGTWGLLGWLQMHGERSGYFEDARGTVLLAAVIVSLCSAASWWAAGSLKQREAARRQTESRALEAAEEIRATLFCISDGVITTDNAGCVAKMNPAAEQFTGWSEAKAAGRPLAEIFRIINEETRESVETSVERVLHEKRVIRLADGQIRGVVLVFRNQTAGQERPEEGTRTRLSETKQLPQIADKSRRALPGMLEDSKREEKHREELEKQLAQAQKMETFGRLAGGVAHDFNNLLGVILGYTEFSLNEMQDNDPHKADLLEVRKAAERAVALNRQLLAFSRKPVLQPVVLCLNDSIADLEKMLRHILGEDIDLVQILAPDLGMIRADPSQIEQVLMNLVANARDAMPEGGKLALETSNVEIDEDYADQHMDVSPGSYVQIIITDSGGGMDEETKSRLFEPFFTTKGKTKGIGLGLSTVFGIIKQIGGHIWVYSELGRGSTFKIFLPRELSAPAPKLDAAAVPTRTAGIGTILLVEDDDQLRAVAKKSLEAAGYTVLAAADGEEALQIASRNAGDIHLLLTDVIMPRMSGRVIAKELAITRPTISILYMSGYADNAIVHRGILDAGMHFIGKPFTADDLRQRVSAILDEEAAGHSSGKEPESKDDTRIQLPVLAKEERRAIPEELLGKLRKAVIAARYDEMVDIIETIGSLEPPIAESLRRMAARFDYEGLRDFLNP